MRSDTHALDMDKYQKKFVQQNIKRLIFTFLIYFSNVKKVVDRKIVLLFVSGNWGPGLNIIRLL